MANLHTGAAERVGASGVGVGAEERKGRGEKFRDGEKKSGDSEMKSRSQ